MRVLVTGSAGFIGNHVSLRLLEEGRDVVGIDNLNHYYDVNLKRRRIERLTPFENYINAPIDINDQDKLNKVFKDYKIDQIIHLAAQAGVRHSLTAPRDYIDANISGFMNILEACRNFGTKHLVYASTSSVYGGNTKIPFSEHDGTNHPKSIYAATKKANELMAHSYSHLFNFPVTGLRFFTVYGPWGRPDMALFKFTKAILNNKPIDLYNNGNMKRDFTYIDDIVESITHILAKAPEIDSNWNSNLPDPATSGIAPYRVYNIGSNNPVNLMDFVEILEKKLGREAIKNYMPMQPGDVDISWANADELAQNIGYTPITPLDKGIHNFVDWYLDYFEIRN
ncbi:MAG TPA: NAD-dependent epimerase [Rhodospirillales bacterium]|nr:NAD-dependent epimerase [Rhodospirillales bacterium]